LWKDELRVGLCPGRLVLARYARGLRRRLIERRVVPVTGDPVRTLGDHVGKADVTVVLSNHYVRYGVLPWTRTLHSRDEWLAYARHHFSSTHGAAAAGWHLGVSTGGRGKARIACAIDAELLERLRGMRCIRSVQPYLMSAFNARRHAVSGDVWFVLQEPGRLTVCLAGRGGWKLVRNRQAAPNWRESLADLLDREIAARDEEAPERVILCAEDDTSGLPLRVGRYRITDLSVPRGASLDSRAAIMALH
jgi:hypothetical protein